MTTEDQMPTAAATAPATEPGMFRCRKGCDRTFPSPMGRSMHEVRAHGKNWDTTKNFRNKGKRRAKYPSEQSKYKRAYYLKAKARNKSKGLNSRGYPYRNGIAPQPQPTDHMADAARAIMLAAQVLRSVSIGMKL